MRWVSGLPSDGAVNARPTPSAAGAAAGEFGGYEMGAATARRRKTAAAETRPSHAPSQRLSIVNRQLRGGEHAAAHQPAQHYDEGHRHQIHHQN